MSLATRKASALSRSPCSSSKRLTRKSGWRQMETVGASFANGPATASVESGSQQSDDDLRLIRHIFYYNILSPGITL